MKDEHFTNPFIRAAYRTALAARRVRRQKTKSFGRGGSSIGRIYVINLDRQSGRWHQVLRELTRVSDERGIPLADLTKRVAAVDARYDIEPAPELVQPSYTLADQLYVDAHPLPLGVRDPCDTSIGMSREEVAVALSHVKTWESIATGDHQYGLVLEDDIYFRSVFPRLLDRAWSVLATKEEHTALDLLYVSYEEARGGAEWGAAPAPLRRPVRGLWQLSGYVLSKRGAVRLLERLPVRGPVDLWINYAFADLDVFALRRPAIRQRLDLPSSNFYSALPVLARVGLLTVDKAPSVERHTAEGPIFGFGEPGTGVTSLATALSMLGLRCCSDVTGLPEQERQALFDETRPRVFDAYVNVGTLEPAILAHLTRLHPEAKYIVTTANRDFAQHQDGQREQSGGHDDEAHPALRRVLRAINSDRSKYLILPAGHHDKWQLLTEFLGCDYPNNRYPQCADQPQRSLRQDGIARTAADGRLRWDSLPWIAASEGWRGVPLSRSFETGGELFSERFSTSEASRWLLRNDTFPGNLALFSPSNFASMGNGAGRLTLRREPTSVREYTSAALSTEDRYRYGRFSADLMPARVSGLVTGMFLHRNSPRQEIDIEFPGNDTTKLLVNIYFNPGEEGARLEYGYRGTPQLIELGFDAADDFHRYEIEWTPERVRWSVDGELLREREHWNPTPVPHLPMQFHINLWHTRSAELAGKLHRRRLPAHAHFREVEVTSAIRMEHELRL